MKTFKYNNAVINIRGEADKKKIEEAAIVFMKKVRRRKNQNGNKNTSRAIGKQ